MTEEYRSGGYYVSQETIDGFLSYKRHRAKNIAIGVGLFLGSNIFGCFSDYRRLLLPLYWGTMAIGIAILVWTFFQPKRYREICSNPLLFFFGPEFIYMVRDIVGSEMGNALVFLTNAAAVMLRIMAGILFAVALTECGAGRNDDERNVQELAQIEIYADDGRLINTILDEEILRRFSSLSYTDIPVEDSEFEIEGNPYEERNKKSCI